MKFDLKNFFKDILYFSIFAIVTLLIFYLIAAFLVWEISWGLLFFTENGSVVLRTILFASFLGIIFNSMKNNI